MRFSSGLHKYTIEREREMERERKNRVDFMWTCPADTDLRVDKFPHTKSKHTRLEGL